MKGVLDSIELQMLRTVDYVRERNFLRETHVQRNLERIQYLILGGYGRARSLLSLTFAAQWNPKHPSYCKYSVVFIITSRSSAAESRLYEMFKATDKWNLYNSRIQCNASQYNNLNKLMHINSEIH